MSGTQLADPTTLSYLARRGVAVQWRGFLRALVETLDAHLDASSRDSLLRAVGGRMAALAPMPACATLTELESRMNDVLAAADWGYVQLTLDATATALLINHAAALSTPAPLEHQSSDELSRGLRVGLEAPLLLSAAFLRATAGWTLPRKLLFISSGLGRRAMAGSAAYCAIKAGMDHLARSIAMEQEAHTNGAKAVSLAPGVIDTDMQVQLRGADPKLFPAGANFVALKNEGKLDSPAQAATKVLGYLARPDFGRNPVADVRDA